VAEVLDDHVIDGFDDLATPGSNSPWKFMREEWGRHHDQTLAWKDRFVGQSGNQRVAQSAEQGHQGGSVGAARHAGEKLGVAPEIPVGPYTK